VVCCLQETVGCTAPHSFKRLVMPADDPRIALSKSKFMAGIQCLKRLYLQVHEPGLAALPNESSMAKLREGREVGELARKKHPDGVLVDASENDFSGAINKTTQLVADPGVPAIFEGAFKQDNIIVRTDILVRQPEGGWNLLEVKSSKSVKAHHAYDVGIQQFILNACSIEASPWLLHLNRDYVYNGRAYDLNKLFVSHDLTAEIGSLFEQLPGLIRQQRTVLSQSAPPEIEPGPQCKDPVLCEFYDHCNPELPEDHVSFLPSISAPKVNQLIGKGITSIHGIPADFPLSERQRLACHCVQTQTAHFGKGLIQALGKLAYPLFFMDFETLSPAIPRFAGMRPYDPVPFQWSIHVRRSLGSEVEHHEFLAEDERDPRSAFLTSLLEVLGHEGHVIVYNRGFESQRLAELARWFPEQASPIAQVQARLWDLLDVVRKNVYHPRFMGSFSLKRVLPALIPDMTYDGMEVSEGEQAGLVWEKMVRGQVSEQEKMKLRKALLAYCSQDTFAMVRLLDFLATASSGKV
jgi:Domain of unknown function(DUF2779)